MVVTSRLEKAVLVLKCLRARPGQSMKEISENTALDDSTAQLVVKELYMADWIKMERINERTFYSAPDEANTVIWLLERARDKTEARKGLIA
jgi:predicted transcriptional regulator